MKGWTYLDGDREQGIWNSELESPIISLVCDIDSGSSRMGPVEVEHHIASTIVP